MEINDLNNKLLIACTSEEFNIETVKLLLEQGAKPMGSVNNIYNENDNLYSVIIDHMLDYREHIYRLPQITEQFLKYGMDISKPEIKYDNNEALNPIWYFAFFDEKEDARKTMKLLLDYGLSADDARRCWGHSIDDYYLYDLQPDEGYWNKAIGETVRMLMLIASYPHIIENDEAIQRTICLKNNRYDITRFRNWNDFRITVNIGGRHEMSGVSTDIIEKSSGIKVWHIVFE